MNRLPTTDLYFRNACAPALAHWWRRAPVRALGANSFQCGDTILLVRRDTPDLMRRALDGRHRLIYLIDDDVAGAAHSPGLPDDYRHRLAVFDRDFHRPLLERADHLVVASPALAALFAGQKSVTAIDPYWTLPIADTAHFRGAGVTQPIHLAHLGTGSHAAGLALLEPALLRLLDSGRNLDFTFIARAGVHPALDAHPRVRRVAPRRWPVYRRWLMRQRFHIGLYPLADTPFDRARSANKLIEHGIVGAVGIYPEGWAAGGRIGDGAIVAPAAPGDWADVIAAAIDDPTSLEGRAFAASQDLPAINNPTMQRSLWSRLLDIACLS